MRGRRRNLESLGKVLDPYFARTGLNQRIQEQRVLNSWDRVVGQGVAEVTQPVRLRNRVLQVKVVSSVWMQQLQFYKKLIIQRLNEDLKESTIQDLWFFLGEKSQKGGKEGKQQGWISGRELTQEEKDRIEREVEKLRDPEMREIFSRMFAKGMVTEKRKRKGG